MKVNQHGDGLWRGYKRDSQISLLECQFSLTEIKEEEKQSGLILFYFFNFDLLFIFSDFDDVNICGCAYHISQNIQEEFYVKLADYAQRFGFSFFLFF